ncbi:MAG: hypothetical protein D6734_02790 [Candidatus Schekmanbacteria bacterium]|nr:MAG: hypothetical protein D6734_02790 [Candidatus Schekmanbacteria bacterium]
MEKILLSKVDKNVEMAMKAKGVKLKKNLTPDKVKKDIIKYLNENTVLHLATCYNNNPRVTPIEYRNDGLKIYIFSEGGVKFRNLKQNPKVSVSIASPYNRKKDYFSSRGLQMWGKAKVYTKESNIEEFRKCIKLMGIDEKKLPTNYPFKVIVIELDKIRYTDPRNGYWFVTWSKK